MRKLWAALLVAIVLLSSCTQSKIDADADVELAGRVRTDAGVPVDRARVAFSKEPGLIEGLIMFSSLGIACLTEALETACNGSRVEETDQDGRFAFELKGSDTQGGFGNASTLDLATSVERTGDELAGPATVQRFQAQTTKLNIPLRLWSAHPKYADDRKSVSVTWGDVKPAIPGGMQATGARYDVVFRQGRQPVWIEPGAKSPKRFDARILEDTAGDVAVFADLDDIKTSPAKGSSIDLLYQTARMPYAARAGIADSRDKPCISRTPRGPQTHSPCALTDGDFAQAFALPAEEEPPATPRTNDSVTIDLVTTKDVDLVVIRGCVSSCRVEASSDNTTWTQFGTGGPHASGREAERDDLFAETSQDVAMRPAAKVRTRYVRVIPAGGLDKLREVSVFDAALPQEPNVEPLALPGLPSTGGRSWALWIGIGIAVALLVAFAFVIGRRRGAARAKNA